MGISIILFILQMFEISLQTQEQWASFQLCLLWQPMLKNCPLHQITAIPSEAIAGLVELKEVYLYGNKIQNFPNFRYCVKLTVLRFERNQLSYIPREHIEGLQSIREIHFTNNLFIDMPDISHLISLQQFLIGYNLITEIPASFIEGLMNMKTFACNNNKLKLLSDISAFSPELEELYVQRNHLKTLPDLFEFPSLATLQAAENPYECNMSMCWLRMLPWLKPSMNILTDIPICDLPPAAADTRVVRFHPTLMKCYNGGSKIQFQWLMHINSVSCPSIVHINSCPFHSDASPSILRIASVEDQVNSIRLRLVTLVHFTGDIPLLDILDFVWAQYRAFAGCRTKDIWGVGKTRCSKVLP